MNTALLSEPGSDAGMQKECVSSKRFTPSCDLQMALLSVEMCSLREENEQLRVMAEVREPSEQLQNAIRDRDDAIAK